MFFDSPGVTWDYISNLTSLIRLDPSSSIVVATLSEDNTKHVNGTMLILSPLFLFDVLIRIIQYSLTF